MAKDLSCILVIFKTIDWILKNLIQMNRDYEIILIWLIQLKVVLGILYVYCLLKSIQNENLS